MKCIASFVMDAPAVASAAAVVDLAEQFVSMPEARALAVVDGGRIAGLIHRHKVEAALRAGRHDQTAAALMDADPLIVQAEMNVAEIADTVLAYPGDKAAPFVVARDGGYLGLCGLDGLLAAVLMSQTHDVVADEKRIAQGVAEEFHRLMRAAETAFRGQVHGLLAMTDRLGRQHLSPDAEVQVRSIRSTGETLLRLADDALAMLQARHGRLELNLQPQRLRELIDDVQDRWSVRAAETGVGLMVSYDGDPDMSALVDSGRLMQVFDNLIENALSYTRMGSVEVMLRARSRGDQVMLEGRVRDTGPGLAAARLARVFDPEGEPSGEGGSLPLSLSRGIVVSMKGSIRAESNIGQGMTVVFDMMAKAATAAAPAPAPERQVSGTPHILVVDDNATNRMVAEALCEMFDCTSETAEDGVEAVEAARSGRFDLILMDIKMPRMDGIAATAAIRALGGRIGATPIVALTANVDPEDARGYLAAGMHSVVEKPIKPDRLLQAINMALAADGEDGPTPRVAAA